MNRLRFSLLCFVVTLILASPAGNGSAESLWNYDRKLEFNTAVASTTAYLEEIDALNDLADIVSDVIELVDDLVDVVDALVELVNLVDEFIEPTNQEPSEPVTTKEIPLKNEQDSLYATIYNGLLNVEPELDVSYFTTDSEEGWGTLKAVLRDHPEIYYFSFEGSLFWDDGHFELKYQFPKSKIIEMNNEIEQKAEKIIAQHIRSNMSEFDKVKAIHNYVVLNTAYDYENYKNNTIPESSHNIYGLLIKGIAVCEGYAESMIYLLDKIGIESLYVSGTANGESHGWNKVKIDGKWYNLDSTWNDPVPNRRGYVGYEYFLIPDSELAKDHSWNQAKFPKATDTKYVSK